MRFRNENKNVSVQAIAGTHVVLLGLNATETSAKGLLGFTVSRRKDGTGHFQPLSGGRNFEGIESSLPVLQTFLWGDYTVDAASHYTYRVTPLYGMPDIPEAGEHVDVEVTTENPEQGKHGIYFNRGVAGSQAYSRKFGEYRKWYRKSPTEKDIEKIRFTQYVKPEDVPDRQAYVWLSRGLEEAMLRFIGQASGPEYSLRAAVYEFTHGPVIQAFVDALEAGVDVKIVHHAKADDIYKEALKAVGKVGISNPASLDGFRQMLIPRHSQTISHNKFIVLLKGGKPLQVWTGSTNFTAGGIYGQSNVGHIVRDEAIAAKYVEYWQRLSADPKAADLSTANVSRQVDLKGAPRPNSITAIFSPRTTEAMLDWYVDRQNTARQSVFLTLAFGLAQQLFKGVTEPKKISKTAPFLRYLLLEDKNDVRVKPKFPAMVDCPQNRVAWGELLKKRKGETAQDTLVETLTGLNDHVSFLHTKYLLIDPLSDDPIVITGSANFSSNSTTANDENMLVIRGDTRVADIFLGEFMRLFNHFRYRNESNALFNGAAEVNFLRPDDSWTQRYYTAGTHEYAERLLFGYEIAAARSAAR